MVPEKVVSMSLTRRRRKISVSARRIQSSTYELVSALRSLFATAVFNSAKVEIDKVMGDKKHPYFDKAHPAHTQAVNDMKALFESMAPNAKEIKLKSK